MTAADLMALVAGVGLGIALRPTAIGATTQAALTDRVSGWVLAAAVAVSVPIFARSVRYGRAAFAAEWLAILVAIERSVDRNGWLIRPMIAWDLGSLLESDISLARFQWAIAGLASLGIVAGLAMLGLGRGVLSPWFKTLTLAGLAWLALWGPISVGIVEGPNLMAPSSGFGPGVGPGLYWLACQHVASLPIGTGFGIPLLAAFEGRSRRPAWTWTEWAGLSVLFGSWMFTTTLGLHWTRGSTFLLLAEVVIDGCWLLAAGYLSLRILHRSRGPWRRWVDGPGPVQAIVAASSEVSPARTA